jgi:anaerobic selenocysteine-containing dehydrogenase
MSDATGHMDRPGAGPLSVNEYVGGIPTNHYTHPNPETGKIEVVRANPPGMPDTVVKEFSNRPAARLWIAEEWLNGRLK